jgi:hypothetical protein
MMISGVVVEGGGGVRMISGEAHPVRFCPSPMIQPLAGCG